MWLRTAGCCTAECPHTQTSPCGNHSPVNRQSILQVWHASCICGYVAYKEPLSGRHVYSRKYLKGANNYFCLCCISLSQFYPLHLPLLNIYNWPQLCVCVCVCVRERERGSALACMCVCVWGGGGGGSVLACVHALYSACHCLPACVTTLSCKDSIYARPKAPLKQHL